MTAAPHACDILVCDLSDGSTVDLVVAVDKGSPAVAVSAALQVVPEPFVSRWQVDLPTGYPDFSEVESTALRQKGQDILRDIRKASKTGQTEIVIPPGDYLFHARWSQASTLKGLADLEITAEGVTFWFEPPMIHGLLFEDCCNVTLRGLTIDFTLPCWFQARVLAENYFGPTSGVPLCIYNVNGLKISGNSVDHPASAAMSTGQANASTVNWMYLQDCDNVRIQANRTPTGKGMFNP